MTTITPNLSAPDTRREKDASSHTTAVVVCRKMASPAPTLEERIQHWTNRGWQIRRREPRVVEGPEGPTHGVLLVLQRTAPLEPGLPRGPIRREIPRRTVPARSNQGA
jgi:hypothetical protein